MSKKWFNFNNFVILSIFLIIYLKVCLYLSLLKIKIFLILRLIRVYYILIPMRINHRFIKDLNKFIYDVTFIKDKKMS